MLSLLSAHAPVFVCFHQQPRASVPPRDHDSRVLSPKRSSRIQRSRAREPSRSPCRAQTLISVRQLPELFNRRCRGDWLSLSPSSHTDSRWPGPGPGPMQPPHLSVPGPVVRAQEPEISLMLQVSFCAHITATVLHVRKLALAQVATRQPGRWRSGAAAQQRQ
jgi:hypothetical protein